jgi:RsiW-degrading membrane proteinase PrsW (M82 family)
LNITDFFIHPTVWGTGLAILMGALWLVPLAPKQLNSISTWLVLILGAAVFAPCIAWMQVPLQSWITNLLLGSFGEDTLMKFIYLTAIPIILLSGIVQEGAKMVPTVLYWFYKGRSIEPKLGLTIGAMAGAGFGIVEAQWVNNMIFSSGWTLAAAQTAGFSGFMGLWERFFTVALHISLGALSGWGLAKGWGWQFYLIAALIHSISNYSIILVQTGQITDIQIEIFIAVIAVILFGTIAFLRWRKSNSIEKSGPEPEIKASSDLFV